jgi:flagellar hook-associated protein 3 FlgL
MSTISTLGQHLRLQARVQATRVELDRLTEEVASGTHADYFEGLGTQSGRGLAMRSAYQQVTFYQDATAVVASQLDGQQQAIGRVKDVAQLMRDQMLSVQSTLDENGMRTVSDNAASYLIEARGALNQTYAGQHLFSGPATGTAPLRSPEAENEEGNSLSAVIAAVKEKHDLKSTDGMQSFLDEVHQVFAGTHENEGWSFAKLAYAGSTKGAMSGIIDSGLEVSTDVRATDPAFAAVFEGLTVAASVAAEEATVDSYKLLAGVLGERLTAGVADTLDLAASVGSRQALVKETKERHDQMAGFLGTGLSELESIDDYAASARLSELQTQLETAYAVTARLSRLSLVSFL